MSNSINNSALIWWHRLSGDVRVLLAYKHFPTITIEEFTKRHIKFIFLAEKLPK